MDKNNLCRCCLISCIHRDIFATYTWLDKTEIYSEMLYECFNINLRKHQQCSNICETCIVRLRDSLNFKLQILKSQKELSDKHKEIQKIDGNRNIKSEPKAESGDSDSDNCLLADFVLQNSCSAGAVVKEETDYAALGFKEEYLILQADDANNALDDTDDDETKRPDKEQLLGTKRRKNKKEKSIKVLVKKEGQKIQKETKRRRELQLKKQRSGDISTTKRKKSKSVPTTIDGDNQTNCTWTTRVNHEKRKHRENLVTILTYSNVTPFKSRSLLGYTCGYCENTFSDPVDLRKHTEIDHKTERLEYRSSFDMTDYHVNLDVTDLFCTLCDEKMTNLTFLIDHLVRVHKKKFNTDIKDHLMQFKLKKGDVYDCAICTSTYETFKMLKQHMNKHYSNYTCSKCDACFAMKRSLNSHQSTHQEGSFKCDHCDKVFSSRSKKQYHEKTKHFGTRHIRNCPYCNEPFRSYYQRNQHLVKVHNSEAQYKCNVCNKSFVLKSLLMCHIKKNHLMERNCQCTECGYSFFSKKALKAHMIKHNGERKYICEVCHKAYARKYTLREHMRIHNDDRRFKCEVCGGAFVQKCSLKSHLLAHHGISLAASDITVT